MRVDEQQICLQNKINAWQMKKKKEEGYINSNQEPAATTTTTPPPHIKLANR